MIALGTLGYWLITDGDAPLSDCLYMTVITISTIGFSEIIDVGAYSGGRLFTMLIALSGIGVLTYAISNLTAHIVEENFAKSFRRRRVHKMIEHMSEHYIVCGNGRLGSQITDELFLSRIPHVVVDIRPCDDIKPLPTRVVIAGDATQDETLIRAGIERAKGLFAATGNDNMNLIVSLSAKHLNPQLRVVARCENPENIDKMHKAGADVVDSPSLIGGLRMMSDMIRPTAVSFLEFLMKQKHEEVHLAEIEFPEKCVGKSLADVQIEQFSKTIPLAIKTDNKWVYPPADDYVIQSDTVLIVMTNPEDQKLINERFG